MRAQGTGIEVRAARFVTLACALSCAFSGVLGCSSRSLVSAEADLDEPAPPAASDAGAAGSRACGLGPPCDPNNLGRHTCQTLGLPAGELSCDPETCFLVLTECGGSGSGQTGAPQPLPTQPGIPGLFSGAGASDGGLFGGGLFGGQPGGQPSDAGVGDEDGGTESSDGGTQTGGFPGGGGQGQTGGGFFGGGFFGGGGNGGGFFGGGFFGGGNGGGFFGGGGGAGSASSD